MSAYIELNVWFARLMAHTLHHQPISIGWDSLIILITSHLCEIREFGFKVDQSPFWVKMLFSTLKQQIILGFVRLKTTVFDQELEKNLLPWWRKRDQPWNYKLPKYTCLGPLNTASKTEVWSFVWAIPLSFPFFSSPLLFFTRKLQLKAKQGLSGRRESISWLGL